MTQICEAVDNCTIPVDVVLQSSDGVQLGAHSKNLELFSEAFPAGGTTLSPEGDVVELSEDAQVLRLLLQCTHIPGPDLSSLDLQALFAFGEAANKYGMFYALQIVINVVNQRIEQHPLQILVWKSAVADFTLIDEAARRTLSIPLEAVMDAMKDPGVFRNWVLYRERWQRYLPGYHNRLSEFWSASCLVPRGTNPSYAVNGQVFIDATERLGPPSRTTVHTTVALFNLTHERSNRQNYTPNRKKEALNALYEAIDQAPRWQDL